MLNTRSSVLVCIQNLVYFCSNTFTKHIRSYFTHVIALFGKKFTLFGELYKDFAKLTFQSRNMIFTAS